MFKRFCSVLLLGIFPASMLFTGRSVRISASGVTEQTGVGPSVEIWMSKVNSANTGMEKALERQADVSFGSGGGDNANTICVDENNIYQKMDGFGASITDASAYLMHTKLSDGARAALMTSLFDKTDGIGLSMLRQTIGDCDHVVSPYNYDPNPDTDSLPNFSISHDEAYIIPMVKEAMAASGAGRMKIIASVWSPPVWMKDNNSVLGFANLRKGSLKSDKYLAYSNYIVRYIQEYQKRGIPIYAVTTVNEPDNASLVWPAMPLSSGEAVNLINNYLYPAFKTNNINSKILCWDHSFNTINYKNGAYVFNVYANSDALAKTDGSAWHWYEGNESTMSAVHKAYPDKDIWFTEGSGGDWGYKKWHDAFMYESRSVIRIVRNWSKSIIFWNVALDQNGSPDYYYKTYQHKDSSNRGLVTINSDTGAIANNCDYYSLGHISKFVDPGAYRIESTNMENNIETVAFKNPDGSKVLVLSNQTTDDKTIKVKWGEKSFSYPVSAEAMVTFKWSGDQNEKTLSPVWFNNFEKATGYNAGGDAVATLQADSANSGGTRCVKLVTSKSGDPASGSQCVRVAPQDGGIIDAAGYNYLVFSVKDISNADGSTLKVTLVDNGGNTWSGWTDEKSVENSWTRIWMPIGAATGIDMGNIKEIRIGEWWSGTYYFDDLSLALGYNDDIPALGGNLTHNPDFENDGSPTGEITGWETRSTPGNVQGLEKAADAKNGLYQYAQRGSSAYDALAYQTVTGLSDGTYTLRAWVKSSGGQNAAQLFAKDYGSTEMTAAVPATSSWVQISVPGIRVSNGQCTVGIYSDANAGDWLCADGVELYHGNKPMYRQLALNPGFDADKAETQTPGDWCSSGDAKADYTQNDGKSKDGSYHLVQYDTSAYKVYTYQNVNGLSDGLYTMKAWVKSSGGQNVSQVQVKDYGGVQKNANIPVTSAWTPVSITDIHVTNGQCTIGFYSDAAARDWLCADGIEFYMEDSLPHGQLLNNPGFDSDGVETQTIANWAATGTNGAVYTQNDGRSKDGLFHLVQYSTSSYSADTSQALAGLPDGFYTLSAYVESSGGQNTAQMRAYDYGEEQKCFDIPVTSDWTLISIPDIHVTNGRCVVGFYSNASAKNWICADDVEFYRQ